MRHVAASHPTRPVILELQGVVCPDRRFTWSVRGVKVRSDGLQFTPAGVRQVIAPWLFAQVPPLLPAVKRRFGILSYPRRSVSPRTQGGAMLIDCDTCAVRGAACGGCVVTALLSLPRQVERLDAAEARAIETLARAGFEVTVLDDGDEAQRAPVTPAWHRGGRMAV